MPLLSVENIAPDVRLGLWKMNETIEDLFNQYPFLLSEKDEILKSHKSNTRRLEIFTEHILFREMFGREVKLLHNEFGKPLLSDGNNVSISHTKGLVAVITSSDNAVSVDVEYVSERVSRIVSYFLREDETAETRLSQLLHWCTKETLYKLYSEDNLTFSDIRLLDIQGNDFQGTIIAENIRRDETVSVAYRKFENFVLTYAVLA